MIMRRISHLCPFQLWWQVEYPSSKTTRPSESLLQHTPGPWLCLPEATGGSSHRVHDSDLGELTYCHAIFAWTGTRTSIFDQTCAETKGGQDKDGCFGFEMVEWLESCGVPMDSDRASITFIMSGIKSPIEAWSVTVVSHTKSTWEVTCVVEHWSIFCCVLSKLATSNDMINILFHASFLPS